MPGLMLNEDDSHFYACRPPEKINRDGVYELVDHYISPPMKELIFNVNAMRANFPSRVWPRVWDGFDPGQGLDQPKLRAVPAEHRQRVWEMYRNLSSLDIPRCWIERVRHHGRSAWLSVRMNDVHDVDNLDLPGHSPFWRDHPEYWRVPDPQRFTTWTDRAFDYGHQPVGEYFVSLIEEVFDRYDVDGLELDWMRFPLHFRPGFEDEGREILIDFHRRVRALADSHAGRRGHPIRIGVRVPSRPQTAWAMGLDAVAWVKEKLVDLVVITPFWPTIEFDMPIELWRELLAGSGATLAAGLEICVRPSPKVWPKHDDLVLNTAETALGAAASLLDRGADRIYLFNYMDSGTTVQDPDDYRSILNRAGDPSTIVDQPRRHVVTYSDTVAPGEPEALALPSLCRAGQPSRFRLHIGPKPERGTARVFVGCGENGNQDTSPLEVHVNGTRCTPGEYPLPRPIHPVVRQVRGFAIPEGILHRGYNCVEVSSASPDPHEVFWIEIRIEPA
ncbi:MAG: hypothetical protein GXY33_15875 [Phycisphaerae bacterium]|nr:hypothetical protein [Phycisphaerae bacterium]